MLTRLFGLFGLVFGLAYANEGALLFRVVVQAYLRRLLGPFLLYSAYISLDFFFGTALFVAAFGLLFDKQWAKKMWLIVTPLLVITHVAVIVLGEILNRETSNFYFVWTAMVVMVTLMSWWKLPSRDTPEHP